MPKITLPRLVWDDDNNIKDYGSEVLESSKPIRINPLHDTDSYRFVSQYTRYEFADEVIANSLLSEELQSRMFAYTLRNKERPLDCNWLQKLGMDDRKCHKKESKINYLAQDDFSPHSYNEEVEKLVTTLCDKGFIDCVNSINVVGTEDFLSELFSNAIEKEIGFPSNKVLLYRPHFSDIAQLLISNGVKIQEEFSLSPGQALTSKQMQKLSMPIALPVWEKECLKSNLACLSFELYIDSYTIDSSRNKGGAYFGGPNLIQVVAGKAVHGEGIQVGKYVYEFKDKDWLLDAGIYIEDSFYVKGKSYELSNAFVQALPKYEGRIVFKVKTFVCKNSIITAKEIYLPSEEHCSVNKCVMIGEVYHDEYPDEL